MLASLKRLVFNVIRRCGYIVISERDYRLNTAPPHVPTDDDIADYQAEMNKYHARTDTADMDPEFLPLYEECRSFSMTSSARMFGLFKAIQYATSAGIPGAIVECGVWRGGSMMLAARTLMHFGSTDRDLYLFDTFAGLPKPDETKDVDIWGNRGIDAWRPQAIDDKSSTLAAASLDEVQRNMQSTGYPSERVHNVRGLVEETIPNAAPDTIAVLRLDTDWYESTRHELLHLYERLVPGGVLIIDDYGHFQGARQAVDEFLAQQTSAVLLNRLDFSGRIAVKPPSPSVLEQAQ